MARLSPSVLLLLLISCCLRRSLQDHKAFCKECRRQYQFWVFPDPGISEFASKEYLCTEKAYDCYEICAELEYGEFNCDNFQGYLDYHQNCLHGPHKDKVEKEFDACFTKAKSLFPLPSCKFAQAHFECRFKSVQGCSRQAIKYTHALLRWTKKKKYVWCFPEEFP